MVRDWSKLVRFTDEEILKKITKVTQNKDILTMMEDKDTYDPEGSTITTITFKFIKVKD